MTQETLPNVDTRKRREPRVPLAQMRADMRKLWPDKYDAAGNEIKAEDKPKERDDG